MLPFKILERLRSCPGVPLVDLPNASGLYAPRDHTKTIRYLGIAHSEGFRVRIRNKHATGSEDRSHKFSAAYNAGRLWRDRHNDPREDAAVSKRVRNHFVLKHCTASVVEIPEYESKAELELIERHVIEMAAPDEIIWNGKFKAVEEPTELVDALIEELRLSSQDRAALDRQKRRYLDRLK